jgi:hypothetical protein
MPRVCRTIAELREELAELPPSARICSVEPPFEGIVVVELDSGRYVICAPGREPKLSRR